MNDPSTGGSLRLAIKDRLRGARFLARELRDTAVRAGKTAGEGRDPGSLVIGRLASVSDSALSRLESLALDFVSADPQAHFRPQPAQPLSRYSSAGGRESRERFARDVYFAAKRILSARGVANPAVSEQALADLFDAALRGGSVFPGDDGRAPAEAAAGLALLLAKARFVLAPAALDDPAMPAGTFVGLVVALATLVATLQGDAAAGEDVFSAAAAAVEARSDAMLAALDAPDAQARLATLFAGLAPHLP